MGGGGTDIGVTATGRAPTSFPVHDLADGTCFARKASHHPKIGALPRQTFRLGRN